MSMSARYWTLGLILCAGSCGDSFAQEKREAATAKETESSPADEQLLIAGGPIAPAHTLIDQPLHTKEGQVGGKINDLIFDLELGRLALIVVAGNKDELGSDDPFLLPFGTIDDLGANDRYTLPLSSAELQAAPRPAAEGKITRQEAAKVLSHFGQQADRHSNEAKITDADQLIPLSRIKKIAVHNDGGKTLGHVRDVAITRRGKIAYVGLAREGAEDQIYPVPLSAFVAPQDEEHWVLELPLDVLEHTPTFPPTAWPKTLDRAWLEYVSVRYGQSVMGGLNHRLKADKAEPKDASDAAAKP